MSKKDLKIHSYEKLLKHLIDVLQAQVLSLVQLHGIDKTWALQFNSVVSRMQSLECQTPQKTNFSYACKELYNYLNRNIQSQNSNRSRAISLKSSVKTRNQSFNSRIFTTSSHLQTTPGKKKPINSSYYSKVMSKFLPTQPNPPTLDSNRKQAEDIWVLGDELKFLL